MPRVLVRGVMSPDFIRSPRTGMPVHRFDCRGWKPSHKNLASSRAVELQSGRNRWNLQPRQFKRSDRFELSRIDRPSRSPQFLIASVSHRLDHSPNRPDPIADRLDQCAPARPAPPHSRAKVDLPNRLSTRSIATSAVPLSRSRIGLSSTISSEPMRPLSAIISIASCASR